MMIRRTRKKRKQRKLGYKGGSSITAKNITCWGNLRGNTTTGEVGESSIQMFLNGDGRGKLGGISQFPTTRHGENSKKKIRSPYSGTRLNPPDDFVNVERGDSSKHQSNARAVLSRGKKGDWKVGVCHSCRVTSEEKKIKNCKKNS